MPSNTALTRLIFSILKRCSSGISVYFPPPHLPNMKTCESQHPSHAAHQAAAPSLRHHVLFDLAGICLQKAHRQKNYDNPRTKSLTSTTRPAAHIFTYQSNASGYISQYGHYLKSSVNNTGTAIHFKKTTLYVRLLA